MTENVSGLDTTPSVRLGVFDDKETWDKTPSVKLGVFDAEETLDTAPSVMLCPMGAS